MIYSNRKTSVAVLLFCFFCLAFSPCQAVAAYSAEDLEALLTTSRCVCDLSGADLPRVNLAGINPARLTPLVSQASEPIAPPALPLPSGTTAEIERLLARNACPGCNLAGADLAGLNLNRANLAGANLSGANLAGASLKMADLAAANLSQAKLTGASLAGADLYKADLAGAILSGADLEGAYLIGTTREESRQKGRQEDIVAFLAQYREKTSPSSPGERSPREKERAQLENLRAPSFKAMQTTATMETPGQDKAELSSLPDFMPLGVQTKLIPSGYNKTADLPLVATSGQVAAPARQETASTSPAVSIPAAVPAAVITTAAQTPPAEPESSAPGSVVPSLASPVTPDPPALSKKAAEAKAPETPKLTNLQKLLQFNRCVECDLAGQDLSGKKLKGALLERSNLSGANLREANLEGANLKGANLAGANLENANLEGADFYRADLSGANLAGANLKDVSGLK